MTNYRDQIIDRLADVAAALDTRDWVGLGELFTESATGYGASGREAIIDITTGNRLSAKWIDKLVYWSHAHSDQEAFAAYFDAWADTDHSAEVPVGRVPALAITGEFDPIASEENIRETWLPLHPDSEIEVLSNCGHYPMFETPIALATRIETFLYMVGMQQEQAKGA